MAEREVPKAVRYPLWVPDSDEGRRRYDLSLALAAEAVGEPAESPAALMAAEVVFHTKSPTD